MTEELTLDLIVEDRAQELFIRALIRRVSGEAQIRTRVHTRSARDGRPKVLRVLDTYEAIAADPNQAAADLIVVAVDSNSMSFAEARRDTRKHVSTRFDSRTIVGAPEPYIERWFLADPESFHEVIGATSVPRPRGSARTHYKEALVQAVRAGGHTPIWEGAEFAPDLVAAMDLYRAGKNVPSLKAFLDDLRSALLRARAD